MTFETTDFHPEQWVMYWQYRSWQVATVVAVNKSVKVKGVYGSYTLLTPERIAARFVDEEDARNALRTVTEITARWDTGEIAVAKATLQTLIDAKKSEIAIFIEGLKL